jgi:hypothetical protein
MFTGPSADHTVVSNAFFYSLSLVPKTLHDSQFGEKKRIQKLKRHALEEARNRPKSKSKK